MDVKDSSQLGFNVHGITRVRAISRTVIPFSMNRTLLLFWRMSFSLLEIAWSFELSCQTRTTQYGSLVPKQIIIDVAYRDKTQHLSFLSGKLTIAVAD
jgi:hypothetical protein